MSAVLAILVDSYRELIAKKLFWFVLAISLLIVVSFGSIGFNDRGISIGYGLHTFEVELLREGSPYVVPFMDMIFASGIVGLWLGWGAIILALVSTAEIFPNFLAGGAIDLVLSKPVRRTTVFFTKYLGGLLFVLLQVAIFCVGTLLVMRWRVGEWRWGVLLAVPVIVLIFSYLYSVMVLFNVLTRSTLPSLVLTMLLWVGLFSLAFTEGVLLARLRIPAEADRDAYSKRVEWYEDRIEEAVAAGDDDLAAHYRARMRGDAAGLHEAQRRVDKWTPIHEAARLTMLLLPKTSATSDLVQRRLQKDSGMTMTQFMAAMQGQELPPPPPPDAVEEESRHDQRRRREQEVLRRTEEYQNRQPWWMIIGSSLLFEAAVLLIACFIFVRRDN